MFKNSTPFVMTLRLGKTLGAEVRLRLWVLLMIIGAPTSVADAMQSASLAPVLLSDASSTRAIALNSVTSMPEPFALETPVFLGPAERTRVTFFALNLAGANPSDVAAEAQDGGGRRYPLTVEFLGPVAVGQQWVTQVILRLSDDLNEVGDILVSVTYGGLSSNRVRVAIGHIGGGPPDDPGAVPTPGPSVFEVSYVLEFDGSPQTVDYGLFWEPDTDLGMFFWEFWAMAKNGSETRYLLSDGYGGAHALLFGMGYMDQRGRYSLTGNIYDGVGSTSFGSDDGPAPDEWGHFAVGWDGRYIVTYFNGVPVGKTAFAGPRRTPGPAGGGGWLLIGGSDHNNLIGRIAQVRGYEGVNPLEDKLGSGRPFAAFAPETLLGITASPRSLAGPSSTFLINFFRPNAVVPDLAGGRLGRLRGVGYGIQDPRQTYPLPQFVSDPYSPNYSTVIRPAQPAVLVDIPAPVPQEARVYDSFSRHNSTRAFDNSGGLGSTEGGTAGLQTWQYNNPSYEPLPFGILNGRAVVLGNNTYAAWVSTGNGSSNLDVRVDRHPGLFQSGISTGLVFRFQDIDNFFYAHTTGDSASTQKLTVGYYNGMESAILISHGEMPPSWTTLRVVTLEAGNIDVYADSTLIYSTVSSRLTTGKNVGLWNYLYGLGLANRWDNFTVLNAR